ncbi:MAG: glycosyltransferase [Puniceicoccales bacterium]
MKYCGAFDKIFCGIVLVLVLGAVTLLAGDAWSHLFWSIALWMFFGYFIGASVLGCAFGRSCDYRPFAWRVPFLAAISEGLISYGLVVVALIAFYSTTSVWGGLGISFPIAVLALNISHRFLNWLFADLGECALLNQKTDGPQVIVWSVNYHPEPTGIGPQTTRMAEALAASGHVVTVVTTFSYYPSWVRDERDARRVYRADAHQGVAMLRCWLYVPRRPTFIRRVAQQISFIVSSGIPMLLLPAPSYYIGVSPPLLTGVLLRVIAFIKGCPYLVHVQDDEIGAAAETSNVSDFALSWLRRIERFGLRGARVLSTISPVMREKLVAHAGIAEANDAALILGNVAHASPRPAEKSVQALRATFPTKCLLVYTGNLGDKQVLDDVVRAASKFSREELILKICGEGAQRDSLEKIVQSCASDNIIFDTLLPNEEHERLLAAADVCLLSEKTHRGEWLTPGICFPSKMHSYLKHGKPLVYYGSSQAEVARVIAKWHCGFALKETQDAFALLKETLAADDLPIRGANGLAYLDAFNRDFAIEPWIKQVDQRMTAQAGSFTATAQKSHNKPPNILGNLTEFLAVTTYTLLVILVKVFRRPWSR